MILSVFFVSSPFPITLCLADVHQSSTRTMKEASPHAQHTERTILTTPRRTPSNPSSTQSKDCPTPSKSKPSTRSYMSPTTSFMAKVSRSVSMGDSLNVNELGEVNACSELGRASGTETSNPRNGSRSKPSSPVVPLPSTVIGSLCHSAATPTLNGSSNSNPSSKNLQTKLTASTRPQLHLDLSKPLPDKPSMASFSPNSKVMKLKDECSNRASACVNPLPGPCTSTFPVQSITCSIAAHSTIQKLHTGQSEGSAGNQGPFEEVQTKHITPSENTVHLQPASRAQHTGLRGLHSSLALSSVCLAQSNHFFTWRLWPLLPSIISTIFSSPPCPSINHYQMKGEPCFLF